MPPRRLLIVLSAVLATAYAAWAIRTGVLAAVDTPTYSRWADLLIAADFNVVSYLREHSFVAPLLFYVLWIVEIAVLKTVLGGAWMGAVVVLNWIAFTIGASATLDTVRRATGSAAAMLLATLLFLSAAELLIFLPYVLSDLMFWGLSTSSLALGVLLAIDEEEHQRARAVRLVAIGTGLAVLAVLFRPVAVPLVVFWIVSVAAWLARPVADRVAPLFLMLTAIALVAAIAGHAYVLANPAAWPFGPLPAALDMVGREAREGMFVHHANPPMLVEPAADFLSFVRITVQKLIFFVTPWLPHYSAAHTVMNLLFFLPTYGLSIAAVANLKRLAPPQRRAVVVLAVFALVVMVFHALLLIDSDHRYRLPLLPALIMLAALGLESVRRPQTLASIGRTR